MSAPKVLSERRGRTLLVTINRPEVRNCVDGETAGLLFQAVESFKNDAALDVLVLTGAGGAAFCSGADLKNIQSLGARPGARESGPMGISRITDVAKPTIAAVEGYCTAGGLELACWCDWRIASREAQFGVLNRRWGVPLLDGGTQRLPRIVGQANALYLIETGVLIDAAQAQRLGLVQEIVPAGQAVARAIEVAGALSAYPQTALRNDRRAALAAATLPIEQGLEFEVEAHRESLNDPEMPEWLARYARGERPAPLRPPDEQGNA
ncbi:MAG: enoyl-CoA hydratase-related protein [Dehalococcoidia bacterium]|nr:enoyl-CoA hydratase-related protein [Dehalococcoidia bacterium]